MREKGWSIEFITDERGKTFIEGEVLYCMKPTAFYGKGYIQKIFALIYLIKECIKVARIIDKRYDFVFGTGGYVMVPVFTAALFKRIPLFILEENVIPGRAVRIFKRFTKKIFWGLGEKSDGNPLRKEIERGRVRNPKYILVIGGSQGAKKLNEIAFKIAGRFKKEKIILIKGKWELPKEKKPANLKIIEFTKEPWKLYEKTKIAVARAGAMVVSELLSFGIPAIFVPFPYAVDNHQYYNAKFVERKEAGFLVEEQELENIFKIIERLLKDKHLYRKVKRNAERLIKKNAAEKIIKEVEVCLER